MLKSTPTPPVPSDAIALTDNGGFTFQGRRTYDDETFVCKLDKYHDADGAPLLYASILFRKSDAAALKQAQRRWYRFRQFVKCPIFASPRQNDATWEKFIAHIGFRPLQNILCNDGALRPLYLHTV